MKKYVFILDLDGTIIGDCIYQAELYKISMILNKLKIKIKINEILEEFYKEKGKLIRPYFKKFIITMKEIYPNSMFYIYTASEKKWAEKEISIIESALNIKFNRPIFTRNDCIVEKKSGNIQIFKSIELIKKKITQKSKITEFDDIEFMIIDDNNVYIDNNDKLLLCSNYKHTFFCNYWDYIPINKITNNIFLSYLKRLIESNKLCPIVNKQNMKHYLDNYVWLADTIRKIHKTNKRYKNDVFWLNLTEIIKKTKPTKFNENTIKTIQQQLAENTNKMI